MPQLKQITLGNRRFSIFPAFTFRQRPSSNPNKLRVAKGSCVGLKRNSDLIRSQVLRRQRLLVWLWKFAAGDARTSTMVAVARPFWCVLEMTLVLLGLVRRATHGVLPDLSIKPLYQAKPLF
jgi:hypothetical protein